MSIELFCNTYCRPFDIFHFIYIEIFYSGKVDVVSNNKAYIDKYLEKKFSFSSELKLMIDSSPLNDDLFFLWPKNVNEDLPLMLEELSICNGITLFKKNEKSLQTFAFATDHFHDSLVNFYINNFDILKNIKKQFLLEYNNSDLYHRYTFFIPPVVKQTNKHIIDNRNNKVRFDNIIKINNKFYLISAAKMRILEQLAYGKTTKEAAATLNISIRTVEKQIELLMNETDIHSRSLLVQAFNRER